MHTPLIQEHNDSQKIVIFIHGFMGSPIQFEDFAYVVYDAGYSYSSVLLPGHGARVNDFIKTDADNWEYHLQSEIDKVKEKYDKIYLVGHSMGGLLAINASLIKENKIAGVVMLSTPLKTNAFNFKFFFPKLKLLLYPKDNEIRSVYFKSNSTGTSNVFLFLLFAKPFFSLHKLIRKTKRNLSQVFVPIRMIHSVNDEMTSYKSAKLLCDGLNNTQRDSFTLYESWHVYFFDDEKAFIKEKLLDFIK